MAERKPGIHTQHGVLFDRKCKIRSNPEKTADGYGYPKQKDPYRTLLDGRESRTLILVLAKRPGGDFIVIIEGVLMYFNEADNRFALTELAKRFAGAELHFDMLNKWMNRQSKMHDTVSKTSATFKFGSDDDKEMEKWHPWLKHQRTYLFNEFKGWRRMGLVLSTLMSIVPVLKTSARAMVYAIKGADSFVGEGSVQHRITLPRESGIVFE